jgi:hypothetical protein
MLGSVLRKRLALAVVRAGVFGAALSGIPAIAGAFAGTSDAQTSSGPSAALTARLAVLQRPQTPADVLPSGLKLPTRGQGTIIPALTRLVATPAGASVYLAVFTPARGSLPLWSPSLGDQVSLVSVTARGAELTEPVPAVDLSNGNDVGIVGAGSRYPYQLAPDYYVGIVPDGVARVAWTFANLQGKHPYLVNAQAANNVVVAPFHSGTPFLLRVTWYTADGAVVPTSDAAALHAIAARQSIERERIIRQDARIRYRPASALLAAFAVFNVTSRTGVTVAGLTISHPALSSLPLAILSITAHAGNPRFDPELDPKDIRQATTRSGVSTWIIPGARSLCVAEVDKPRFPLFAGTGAGMGCSRDVASAVSDGSGVSSGYPGGITWHYGVLPNTKPTLTIRTGPHSHKTIHPPDGVYIYRTGG